MRLINTTTLALEEFSSPDARPYAILSHTWEDEEVTFQIWSHADPEVRRRHKGFAKIERACHTAKTKGLHYAWVDACCINKESSAELTEAINSMFTWYQKAATCLVYLSDFPAHAPEFPDPLLPRCRWFTRGWTLQELIGPKRLTFYDREWNDHGGKRLRSYEICTITGIDVTVLEDSTLLHRTPVGRKMSWAAGRQTTREEDIAYCLLGIFDVNMSLIYGEGSRAFLRLQEEIMKRSNDMTLFAWTSRPEDETAGSSAPLQKSQTYRGILARSPAEFANCREVIMDHSLQLNLEFTVTNSGLRMRTSLAEVEGDDYILFVGSQLVGKGLESSKIGIRLLKTTVGFYRHRHSELYYHHHNNDNSSSRLLLSTTPPATFLINKDTTSRESNRVQHRLQSVRFTLDLPPHLDVASITVRPSSIWNAPAKCFISEAGLRYHAIVHIRLYHPGHGAAAPTARHKRTHIRFFIICELYSAPQEGRTHAIWSLVFSELDAQKYPAPWGRLFEFADEYIRSSPDEAGTGIGSLPENLAQWCAQLAVTPRTPQHARLEARKGRRRTGIVVQSWPGEMNVVFPTVSWWGSGEICWNGNHTETPRAAGESRAPLFDGGRVGSWMPSPRRWTHPSRGSDGSTRTSVLTKAGSWL